MTQPQHEGKPLSEAELEAIRERECSFLFGGELYEHSVEQEAVFDRRSLLQHIAWLSAKLESSAYWQVVDELRANNAKLTSAEARCKVLDMKLRRTLWLRHGHLGLYGDDGEMQCSKCRLDYLRDSLDAIETRLREQAQQALSQGSEVKQ